MNIFKTLALVLPLALVACGGGGGDPGTSGGDGGTPTDPKTGTVAVQLYNGGGAKETATNTISASDVSGYVKATVADAAGKPVSGAIVTFGEKGSGLLTFSPSSATALTDGNGMAEIDVKATSVTGTGATQITASAEIPQKTGDPVTVTGTE